MGILVLIVIAGIIVWAIKLAIQQAKLLRDAHNSFMAEHRGWDVYILPDQSVVALHHAAQKIVLGRVQSYKTYQWSSIASVDVLRNGTSITNTNRGSQLMGAAAGGLLLGPMGFLIGGLTGSKRTAEKVKEIAIRIIVDDRTTPVYVVRFISSGGAGVRANNELVRSATERAEHVHALLINVMRNASSRAATVLPQVTDRSLAERIDQLWKLRELGALSANEYEVQKAEILGVRQL